MISRSTLIGALVVAEIAIVGMAVRAVAGTASGPMPSSTAAAGLNRAFLTGPAPVVAIDGRDADVILQATSAPEVRVVETVRRTGFVSGDVPPAEAERTPNGVRIAVTEHPRAHFMIGTIAHELRVSVPAAATVELTSGARIDAGALRGKLIGHLESGSIRVSDHRGDVDVSTGDGSIRLVDVQGTDIAASTRDGRVYLTRVGADRINVSSASGRIVGADIRAADGALSTKDGRIILSFTRNSDAVVTARSADDDVRVNGLTVTEHAERQSVIRLGNGRGRFDVSTESGPITISQGASV